MCARRGSNPAATLKRLSGLSSHFGQQRLSDAELTALRFAREKPAPCQAGANVTQIFARKGIAGITPDGIRRHPPKT